MINPSLTTFSDADLMAELAERGRTLLDTKGIYYFVLSAEDVADHLEQHTNYEMDPAAVEAEAERILTNLVTAGSLSDDLHGTATNYFIERWSEIEGSNVEGEADDE